MRMTEDQLLHRIRVMASQRHLLLFHCHDSRIALGKGFPDLVIAGRIGTVFAELKVNGASLTPDQRHWGALLSKGGERWFIWRPRDLYSGAIQTVLDSLTDYRQEALPAD